MGNFFIIKTNKWTKPKLKVNKANQPLDIGALKLEGQSNTDFDASHGYLLYGFTDIDVCGEATPYSHGTSHSGTSVSRVSLSGLWAISGQK